MTDEMTVRPTKRCLDDLGVAFPPLSVELHTVDHILLKKAQQIPAEVAAGGGQRILSVRDRIWYKCKVANLRGAVVRLSEGQAQELVAANDAWWWIGAAGERRQDSVDDFYSALEAEIGRRRARGEPESDHLLPQRVDYRRLVAEVALQVTLGVQRTVREVVHRSLVKSAIGVATVDGYEIKALVRAESGKDGEAYVAIGAEGFTDPRMIAVMLDALPGVDREDWLVEPDPTRMNLNCNPGQIVHSAIIPPETQSQLLAEFEQDE